MFLEEEGILGFHLLAGTVVRIAVVHAYRARHAVLGLLRAPATTERASRHDEEAPILRRHAVDQAYTEVRVMRGNGPVGDRALHGLEYRVDDGHRVGHPPAHRRG